MNYLTRGEAGDKLAEEIENCILSRIPDQQKGLYVDILSGVGKTIYGLLRHLHKFLKEDTGKLIANPFKRRYGIRFLHALHHNKVLSRTINTTVNIK